MRRREKEEGREGGGGRGGEVGGEDERKGMRVGKEKVEEITHLHLVNSQCQVQPVYQ